MMGNQSDDDHDSSSVLETTSFTPTALVETYSTNDESSSDESLQMQVLEKEVVSDKEEENDEMEDIMAPAYDTDDDSMLLSPSALPASALFRPFSPKTSLPHDGNSHSRNQSMSNLSTSEDRQESSSPIPSTSIVPTLQTTVKRGRGRPRKYAETPKKFTIKKTNCKKAREEVPLDMQYDPPQPSTSAMAASPVEYEASPLHLSPGGQYLDEPIDYDEEMLRVNVNDDEKRENGDTFVYAKHRFVGADTDFRCDSCNVSFTASSSLKRHYGTIYHKQKYASHMKKHEGNNDYAEGIDDGYNISSPGSTGLSNSSAPKFRPSDSSKAFGLGKKRSTTVVRRSAVDNIKKYYAAADARRRQDVSRSKRLQTKVDLKKNNVDLQIYDFDDDDDGAYTSSAITKIDNGINDCSEKTFWLSNSWKGTGIPHFTCEVCGDEFSKKMEFTEHLFKHRSDEQDEKDKLDEEKKINLANLLNARYKNWKSGRKKPVGEFQCSKCPSVFCRKEYYDVHVKNHDRGFDKCTLCDEKFDYKYYLVEHMKTVHAPPVNAVVPAISNGSDNGDAQERKSTPVESGDMAKNNRSKNGKMHDNSTSGEAANSKGASRERREAVSRNLQRTFDGQKDNIKDGKNVEKGPLTIAIPSQSTNTSEYSTAGSSKMGLSTSLQGSHNMHQGPLPLLGCGGVYNLVSKPAENQLTCQDCGKEFEHRKSLVKHVKYYSQQEEFSCRICNKSFKLKHHVSRHMRSFHNIDTVPISTLATTGDIMDDCGGSLDDIETDSGHSPSETSEGPPENLTSFDELPPSTELNLQVLCSNGGDNVGSSKIVESTKANVSNLSIKCKTATEVSLDEPISDKEQPTLTTFPLQTASPPPGGTTIFTTCKIARLTKKDIDSFYVMSLTLNGGPCFTCLICVKKFATRGRMNAHLWQHKRAAGFECGVCYAGFKCKHDLNTHHEGHAPQRIRYGCTECPKSFSWKKDLLKHMRIKHGGVTIPIELTVTGERHHRCQQCTLLFLDIYDLNAHIGEVHEAKNVCQTCGQSLMSAQLLEEHMSEEHGDDDQFNSIQNSSDDDELPEIGY